MRTATRVATLIIGLIGAFDGFVVNVVVSSYHDVSRVLGGSADPSHGFIGLVLCVLALLGAFVVLKQPLFAAILLAVAGIGFFFIVHWWALLASPQMLVAALLAGMEYVEMSKRVSQRGDRTRDRAPATTA